MIRQLRRRFIFITMISVLVVLGSLMTVINAANFIHKDNDSTKLLSFLSENNGRFPDERRPGSSPDSAQSTQQDPSRGMSPDSSQGISSDPSLGASLDPSQDMSSNNSKGTAPGSNEPLDMRHKPEHDRFSSVISVESPYETRFFTVTISSDGSVSDVNTDQIAAVSADQAEEMALSLMSRGKTAGYYDTYKYQATETDNGTLYIFLDCRRDLSSVKSFLEISLLVSLIGFISIFLLVVLLSGRVIRPVEESYRKQKEFITNASHELKTPLAVIDSCADVLSIQETDATHKWISGIKDQVKRLSGLIQELIVMARMDENEKVMEKTEFSLSDLCIDASDPYSLRAESEGFVFSKNVAENINYRGDADQLSRLLSILLDNAFKYTPKNGNILLSLEKKGNRVYLSVKNDTEPMVPGKKEEFFDRFYRSDESHNSEVAGYGIGLSMARSIVRSHSGKIEAVSPDGRSLIIKIRF